MEVSKIIDRKWAEYNTNQYSEKIVKKAVPGGLWFLRGGGVCSTKPVQNIDQSIVKIFESREGHTKQLAKVDFTHNNYKIVIWSIYSRK